MEGEKDQDYEVNKNWTAFVNDVDPNQQKLDKFVVIKPSPPKISTPPKVSPTKEVSPLKQTLIFEYTSGTPENYVPKEKPVQEEVVEEKKEEKGKQLTLDGFQDFQIPKRRSMAPMIVGNTFLNAEDRENAKKEKMKLDASRRKSTPLPQKKGLLLDKSYHTQSLTPQANRRKSTRQDTPFPKRKEEEGKEEVQGDEGNIEEEEVEEEEYQTDGLSSNTKLFIIILSFIFLFSVAFYGFKSLRSAFNQGFPHGERFCYSRDHDGSLLDEDCQPCPLNGYCFDGKLSYCEPPFIKAKDIAYCIENNPESQEAIILTSKISYQLKRLAGEKACGGIEKDYIEFKDVKKDFQLENESMKELILGKFLQMIESPEFEIRSEGQGQDLKLFSTRSILPWTCKIKKALKENITSLIICAIILLVSFIFNQWSDKKKKQKEQIERLTALVISKLKEKKTSPANDIFEEIKVEFEDEIELDKHWEFILDEMDQFERVIKKKEGGELIWEWSEEGGDENLNKKLFE